MKPNTTIAKVEAYLLSHSEPISTPGLSRAIGSSKTSISCALSDLRAKYGPRLQSKMRDGAAWHQLTDEAPVQHRSLIEDLWRGWRNPYTHYQPARLGV